MEDALDGIKDYFTSNLEAALVTIETARSCTITRWKVLDTYMVQSRQLPAIMIIPEGSAPEYLDEEGPGDEAWYTHNIMIITASYGNNPKDVMYELMRYQEAYVALINADNTFGSVFNRIQLGASDFDEIREAQDEKRLIQILYQAIEVREVL